MPTTSHGKPMECSWDPVRFLQCHIGHFMGCPRDAHGISTTFHGMSMGCPRDVLGTRTIYSEMSTEPHWMPTGCPRDFSWEAHLLSMGCPRDARDIFQDSHRTSHRTPTGFSPHSATCLRNVPWDAHVRFPWDARGEGSRGISGK